MPMPKTPVYKYYRFVFRQHDIRFAGQRFYMQPVAETVFMQKPAHQHFGLGILTTYARHVVAPRFFGMYIGHCVKVLQTLLLNSLQWAAGGRQILSCPKNA